MINEIAESVFERLKKECPKEYGYQLQQWFSSSKPKIFHTIQWTEIMPPRLKQRGLAASINFYDDRATYDLAGVMFLTFQYCDPEFPDNLINHFKRTYDPEFPSEYRT